jgi:hypothetical protein
MSKRDRQGSHSFLGVHLSRVPRAERAVGSVHLPVGEIRAIRESVFRS